MGGASGTDDGAGAVVSAASTPPPSGAQPDHLAAASSLAAGVVHELGGTLAVLVTNLTVATEHLLAVQAAPQGSREPPPELGAALGEALEATQHLRALVGDLKIFTRFELPGGPPADLRVALDAVLRLLQHELRHRALLKLELGPVARVKVQESRLAGLLFQLFVHLLERLPREVVTPVTVQVVTRGQGPELVVALGEAPHSAAHAASPGSTGEALRAGFSFVRGAAEQLGCSLDETPNPAGGTLLRLGLPAASQSTRPASDPALLAVLPPPRVLVIDDEPLLCDAVRRMLAGEAHVETTNSPQEGLARLLGSEVFDAVLCDLLMPGMNGMELFLALEAQRPEVAGRLGFVTGGAFSEEGQAFLRTHAPRVLEKPFSRSGLRGLLRALVSGKFAPK